MGVAAGIAHRTDAGRGNRVQTVIAGRVACDIGRIIDHILLFSQRTGIIVCGYARTVQASYIASASIVGLHLFAGKIENPVCRITETEPAFRCASIERSIDKESCGSREGVQTEIAGGGGGVHLIDGIRWRGAHRHLHVSVWRRAGSHHLVPAVAVLRTVAVVQIEAIGVAHRTPQMVVGVVLVTSGRGTDQGSGVFVVHQEGYRGTRLRRVPFRGAAVRVVRLEAEGGVGHVVFLVREVFVCIERIDHVDIHYLSYQLCIVGQIVAFQTLILAGKRCVGRCVAVLYHINIIFIGAERAAQRVGCGQCIAKRHRAGIVGVRGRGAHTGACNGRICLFATGYCTDWNSLEIGILCAHQQGVVELISCQCEDDVLRGVTCGGLFAVVGQTIAGSRGLQDAVVVAVFLQQHESGGGIISQCCRSVEILGGSLVLDLQSVWVAACELPHAGLRSRQRLRAVIPHAAAVIVHHVVVVPDDVVTQLATDVQR